MHEIEFHRFYNNLHETENGFKNIWPETQKPSPGRAAGWLFKKGLRGDRKKPAPNSAIDPQVFKEKIKNYRIFWLGHATVLIQYNGINIITDPVFSDRVSPVSFAGPERLFENVIDITLLPRIDFVVISHSHYDHLDRNSIEKLAAIHGPVFLTPRRVGDIISEWGISRVIDLDWWQYITLKDVTFTCTPAKHFSARGAFDRNQTLWASWYIRRNIKSISGKLSNASEKSSVYFAGDTAYSSHFSKIKEGLGPPAVALLPIGAYEPNWFMSPVHINPAQALQAYKDLEAKKFFAIHWGTFDLADEEPDQPPEDLKKAMEQSGAGAGEIYIPEAGSSIEG